MHSNSTVSFSLAVAVAQIGLMRSGHLLAEESPHNLLALYGLSSLEDVFLKLCMKDMGAGKHPAAPVVATISTGAHAYAAGHDNPVFSPGYGANPDAAPAAEMDHHNEDDDEDHKNLAQLSIVSSRVPSPA